MNEELFNRLRKIISRELGVDEAEISLPSHLQDDLNADPISLADLNVKIEEEFNVKIPEDLSTQFATVEDILNFVSDQSGEI